MIFEEIKADRKEAINVIFGTDWWSDCDDVVEAFLRLAEKGEFRAEDDDGGGTTEDINNIHKHQNEESEDGKSG